MGCAKEGGEAPSISYWANFPWWGTGKGINRSAYCHLKPNTQYYLNVKTNSGDGWVDKSTCGFSYVAN